MAMRTHSLRRRYILTYRAIRYAPLRLRWWWMVETGRVAIGFTGFREVHRCRWYHRFIRRECPTPSRVTGQVLLSVNLTVPKED